MAARAAAHPAGPAAALTALALLLGAAAPAPAAEPDFSRASAEGLELLQQIVRLDTSNPPGNETPVAKALEAFLTREGLACEVLEAAPGRGNLVCRLKGGADARPLLVMAHMDVVGVGEGKWKVPPFSGTLRDGYIYGRGTLDDKGMAAAAAEAIALLARARQPLARDVLFVGTADEESSGAMGVQWLLEHRPDLLQAEMVLNEGGRILKVDGRIVVAGVQNDEKRYLDLKLVASGASGHSSLPGPDNPIVALARGIDRLAAHRFPSAATPDVRAWFEALSRSEDAPTAHCMTALGDPSEGAMCADILSRRPEWNALLRTTCTPTIVRAGFRENAIPSQAAANLNCRLLPGVDPRQHVAELERALGELPVKIETANDWGKDGPPPASPMNGPLPQAIRAALKRLAPEAAVVAYTSPGGTDSRHFRQHGVPAYGLLPFPLEGEEPRTMHADNERLSQESFAFGVRLMFEVLREAAGH